MFRYGEVVRQGGRKKEAQTYTSNIGGVFSAAKDTRNGSELERIPRCGPRAMTFHQRCVSGAGNSGLGICSPDERGVRVGTGGEQAAGLPVLMRERC